MTSKHVIIADPDRARREALAALFRDRGDHVIPVEDAVTAAEAVTSSRADYLMMLLDLPSVDRQALRHALDPAATATLEPLESLERRHIAYVLNHTGGNRSRAARLLDISRSTLLSKIRRYDLP